MENRTEEFRRQPPPPLGPRPLNLPAPDETVLPNGLRIVVAENRRLPLVSIRLVFRTGSSRDPQDLPGLTDVLTEMLSEGTESRTSRQIADQVARLGATLMAGTNSDYATVAASALAGYSEEIFELLADITLHPSFPADELELTKQNALQNLIAQRGQPSFLATERLARVLYGEHPYAVVSPTPQSIEAMTRERLAGFHRSTFLPNNGVLIVVGDVRRDEVVARAGELFGDWPTGPALDGQFPAPPERAAREIHLVDRPGSAQSNIIIANLALNRTSPDYFPALLMHTILGANASSRLFMNLREEKGYTYGAYSNLDARRTAGSFRMNSEVRTPVTGASLKEFFYEIERIREEPVTDKELQDAKSYLTGVFPIRLETQEGLIDQLVQIKMFDLPQDYLETYRDRASAVTKEEVQRSARKYITPDRAAIVIVGDAAAIMDEIKPFAPTIELYDSAGNRKEMEAAADREANLTAQNENRADLAGTWTLEVKTPGGPVLPATLLLRRQGDTLSGTVQSSMGNAPLSQIRVEGGDFNALLSLNMQGQKLEAKIDGRIEGEKLTGTITLSLPIAPPLTFTGTRASG